MTLFCITIFENKSNFNISFEYHLVVTQFLSPYPKNVCFFCVVTEFDSLNFLKCTERPFEFGRWPFSSRSNSTGQSKQTKTIRPWVREREKVCVRACVCKSEEEERERLAFCAFSQKMREYWFLVQNIKETAFNAKTFVKKGEENFWWKCLN